MEYELLDYEKVWLEFINSDGIKKIIDEGRQEEYIGKKVIINNKETPDYNVWEIADFNHDDSGYTVDLIADYKVITKAFDNNINNNYVDSEIRTWLNGEYYNGFSSNIREKMDTMSVKTDVSSGLVTTNDKVKLLSCREMNVSSYHDYMPSNEGSPYPIFPNYPWNNSDNSVNKRRRSGAYSSIYWLWSRNTDNTNRVWGVGSYGYLGNSTANSSLGIVPVLRFKNV